jgi:GNAT superfamily N-acetyltransferase
VSPSTAPPPTVRPAHRGEHRAVAALLARAFHDDPVYRWLFPEAAARARRLPGLMETYLRRLRPDATVELAVRDGRPVAAAVWDAPEQAVPGTPREAAALPGMLRAVRHRLPDLARLGGVLDEARPREPHWYLFHLGTEPDQQGTGGGAALLRSMTERRDRDRLPSYLECKPELVGFYGRFGFDPIDELPVRGLDVVMRAMWRDPAPPEH